LVQKVEAQSHKAGVTVFSHGGQQKGKPCGRSILRFCRVKNSEKRLPAGNSVGTPGKKPIELRLIPDLSM
jgi:hypothetical protein